MPRWGYDPKSKRYRNLDTGRYAVFDNVLGWAREYAQASGQVVTVYSRYVAQGMLRVQDWQGLMRDEIKKQYINQYLVGRGGLNQMTQRDWGIIGRALRDQYRFLDGFAADVAAGKLSPAQIQARARMYVDAAHVALERGRAEAFGMPTLPAYPGDGQTQCLTNCRCNWDIQEVRDEDGNVIGWNATWVLDPHKQEVHCPDCPNNAAVWNHLFVPAGMGPRQAAAWRKDALAQVTR